MTFNKLFLLCFGAWGKVGINCFMLITGYFMCTSSITLKKFLKLILQVEFYKVVIGCIFFVTGYETFGLRALIDMVLPITTLASNFTGCFLVFFLTIPFLNAVVNNISKRQHKALLLLTIGFFSLMPTIPIFSVRFNYVEWFIILYFISSYLRKYPTRFTENRRLWAGLSIVALIGGVASVVLLSTSTFNLHLGPFYFVADSNKFTALAASICFFLAFKPQQKIAVNSTVNLNLQPQSSFYSPLINTIASATFGVLLIHANSNAMRRWLWKDVCDVAGWYQAHSDSLLLIVAHAIGCVLAIFTVCAVIDLLRQRFIEKPLFAKLFPSE